MSKGWNVKVDEHPYSIQLKSYKIMVNNESLKLNSYFKNKGMLQSEYEFPIGSKKATLYLSSMIGGQFLVIDGKNCATGADYVPVVTPKWSYIFVVLHLLNFLNGMLGVLAAIIGCSITVSISSNSKFNVFVKILLNIATLIIVYAVVFGIALAMTVSIYG